MIDLIVPPPPARLVVIRSTFTGISTIGNLELDRLPFCLTIEDTVRAGADGILQASEKVQDRTAIPAGVYELDLLVSGRFGFCPWLINVPLFEDVRIHWGNTAVDTRGCLLVGRHSKTPDEIIESRATFADLMMELVPICKLEKIFLEITGGPSVEEINQHAKAA